MNHVDLGLLDGRGAKLTCRIQSYYFREQIDRFFWRTRLIQEVLFIRSLAHLNDFGFLPIE